MERIDVDATYVAMENDGSHIRLFSEEGRNKVISLTVESNSHTQIVRGG